MVKRMPKFTLIDGTFDPAIPVVITQGGPHGPAEAPVVGSWIPTLSDIILGAAAVFLTVAHFIGWFLESPWPVRVAGTIAALGAPFLVWLRVSDAWHRRRLTKFLADRAERGEARRP